jgi:hypothetical protein
MKKRLIDKRLMLIKVMGHNMGWVGFALDPPLQTMGSPSIMAINFRVKTFFTMTGWRCSKDVILKN